MNPLVRLWLVGAVVVFVLVAARPDLAAIAQTGQEATISALQTEAASLQTMVALQTEVAALRTEVAGGEQQPADVTPTPESDPEPGTVLYEANADNNGFEDWSGPTWEAFNGMLLTDGREGAATAPFQIPAGVSGVAVEAEMQIVRRSGYQGRFFGVQSGPVSGGYDSVTRNFAIFVDGDRTASNDPGSFDIESGDEWHTYRLEIEGNAVRILIDGSLQVRTTENRLASTEDPSVGVWTDNQNEVSVRSFRVIAL